MGGTGGASVIGDVEEWYSYIFKAQQQLKDEI